MSNPNENRTAKHLDALKNDVSETTNILKVTVDKLVDREDKLNDLNQRAGDLSASSYQFHGASRRIQRRMKWKNYKMTIIIVLVVLVVIGVILLVALKPWSH